MAKFKSDITGDIWALHPSHFVVIPTNAGYTQAGANVMGRGLARQAAVRFPSLPREYGAICQVRINALHVMPAYWLIMFPVKPLIPSAPGLSWNQDASLELIERSAEALAVYLDHTTPPLPLIAMPMVGCGLGKLSPADVLPVLERELGRFENVVLVRQER